MSIREQHPFGRQPIHVRRLGLRIAFQHVGPVIQIIDRDEQYVWLTVLAAGVFSFTVLAHSAKEQNGQNEDRCLFVCLHSCCDDGA